MKHIPQPEVPDVANVRALSRRANLASYPALRNNLRAILHSYAAYRVAGGNALAANAPVPLALDDALVAALKDHYSKEHTPLKKHFTKLRDESSPEVCPMCGSLGTGTLDHVFPQIRFPEFALFGKNLVPACICNSKRGNTLVGNAPGQRILHPYFDTFLNQPLVRALIQPSPERGIRNPIFGLVVVLPQADPNYAAVSYHVDKVIKPTQVLAHFARKWAKYSRRPEKYFDLGAGHVSQQAFAQAANEERIEEDDDFETPNNWKSMLLAGIVATPDACAFLAQRINELRGNGQVAANLFPA
jgi:hypothetical protein